MATLIIKELTNFKKCVRRDIIADVLSRPKLMPNLELMERLTLYGNQYLLDHREPDAVIWFDFYFGDPAIVGMTWAHNPMQPIDPKTGDDMFWRIWSETESEVTSLTSVRQELADYIIQHSSQLSSQGLPTD